MTNAESHSIRGYLIAGGESKRMGRDKRITSIGDETFIERAYHLLEKLLHHPPTVVGDNLTEIIHPDWRVINDARSNCGPLGGLVAALNDAPVPWVLILATDLPLMTIEELKRLVEHCDDSFDVISLTQEKRPEPLAALYNISALNFWQGRLEQEAFSLMQGLDLLRLKLCQVSPDSRVLQNINSVEDLKKLDT